MLHFRWAGLMIAACAMAASAGAQDAAAPVAADMLDSLRVPEGLVAERAAGPPLTRYPMFMTFDDRGALYVAESSGLDLSGQEMMQAPGCSILRLTDADDDGVYDAQTVFAAGLSLPMGVLWHQDALFVASPPELIRLQDNDGDGAAELRETVLSGWNILNTASLHGPFLGPDGWLYLTHGRHGFTIPTKAGPVLEGKAARLWRCLPDGTGLEAFCGGGFDNPVELIFTGGGDVLGTMTYFTDPRQGQRDALMHWVEGGVYPKPHEVIGEFVRTGDLMPTMTKFARIAPSGFAQVHGAGLGPEYAGALFSAQFNPSRVQRHTLSRDEATYRTEDADFLTSADPNFHPTDVLEDIDGTLLVCDTGGWYVDACPISRVARPEYAGGIYRVRRADHLRPQGLWAAVSALRDAPAEALLAAADDPRPPMHDAAREQMAARGAGAWDALAAAVGGQPGTSARQRRAAVWAYGRNLPPERREPLYRALGDADAEVRMAAAHQLGMLRDAGAVPALTRRLSDGDLAVRRQAATALGRIGDAGAAPALLAACDGAGGRLLEHALIYALIRTNDAATLNAGLAAAAPAARKAALIAIDQTNPASLAVSQVLPFLADADPALRQTGLWVASRHPDWAGGVVAFVAERLRNDAPDPAADAAYRSVLIAYAGSAAAQEYLAAAAADAALPAERRKLALDAMAQGAAAAFPQAWIDALGALLAGGDAALRWAALEVARTRGLAALDPALEAIAGDAAADPALRLAAIDALAARNAALDDARFALAAEAVAPARDPTLRQAGAAALARAALTAAQQARVAKELLPGADGLVFAPLLEAAAKGGDAEAGAALVQALSGSAVAAQTLDLKQLDALLAPFPEAVRAAAAPLRAKLDAAYAERVARLEALGATIGGGDVGRGRRVFFGEKAACYTCHAVGNEGGNLGPDLTTIGLIRSKSDLLEALLFPSASQVPGYESYLIEARDPDFGTVEAFEGLLGDEDAASIVVKTGVNAEVRVPRDRLVSMTRVDLSKMPANLEAALTETELNDLIAFLVSLNNEQWLLPERRETP